jgi:hypothetical protein
MIFTLVRKAYGEEGFKIVHAWLKNNLMKVKTQGQETSRFGGLSTGLTLFGVARPKHPAAQCPVASPAPTAPDSPAAGGGADATTVTAPAPVDGQAHADTIAGGVRRVRYVATPTCVLCTRCQVELLCV